MEQSFSEPDLSDDDMGAGLGLETQEQIDRIQAGANDPQDAGEPASDVPTRKRAKKTTSPWLEHFIQGEVQQDGTYSATCKYCGLVIIQGNQKGTSSLKGHIKRGCKKIPRDKRFKPDAMQRMLQAGSVTVKGPVLWAFDQARCRKGLARMVISHEYPFNCVRHYFFKAFLNDLQPCFVVPSRNTLRHDCIRVYEEEHDLLYELLCKLDCKFSFTSDLWTAKGKERGFITITCHFSMCGVKDMGQN